MKFVTLAGATAFETAITSIDADERMVVCGSEEDQSYIEEALAASSQSVDSIIAGALNVDVVAWFEQRQQALLQDASLNIADLEGAWAGEAALKQGFNLAFDMMTGEQHVQVAAARIETDASWTLPAYFKFGGWNQCPNAEVHCAIWQYWHETYGAEIIAVSNDVIEAYVTKPPATEEEAMVLAWQQYLYCNEIVDHGVESVANLAASIMNHNAWLFWWD